MKRDERYSKALTHWTALHAKLDTNQDGVVSFNELTTQLCEGVGELAAENAARQFMSRLDLNKDGAISSEEWLSGCASTQQECVEHMNTLCMKLGVDGELQASTERLVERGDDAAMREAFTRLWEHCDTNHDGKVVVEELKHHLTNGWARIVAKDYAAQLMARTDENHDGEISLEEWQAFFEKVWSDEPGERVDQTMEYLLFGSFEATPKSTQVAS